MSVYNPNNEEVWRFNRGSDSKFSTNAEIKSNAWLEDFVVKTEHPIAKTRHRVTIEMPGINTISNVSGHRIVSVLIARCSNRLDSNIKV